MSSLCPPHFFPWPYDAPVCSVCQPGEGSHREGIPTNFHRLSSVVFERVRAYTVADDDINRRHANGDQPPGTGLIRAKFDGDRIGGGGGPNKKWK